MKRNKRGGYGRNRIKALTDSGHLCGYCGDEATQADHIVPYAWGVDNSADNIVACCVVCNLIAGSKVFDSFHEKKQYILSERMGRKWSKRLAARRVIVRKRGEGELMTMPREDPPEVVNRGKKGKRAIYRGEPGAHYGIKPSQASREKTPERRIARTLPVSVPRPVRSIPRPRPVLPLGVRPYAFHALASEKRMGWLAECLSSLERIWNGETLAR